MCNCIKEIEDMFLKKQPLDGKKILTAQFDNRDYVQEGNGMKVLSSTPIKLGIDKRRHMLTHKVINTFCPFCGEKYLKAEDKE